MAGGYLEDGGTDRVRGIEDEVPFKICKAKPLVDDESELKDLLRFFLK